jgi:hypothetical protein
MKIQFRVENFPTFKYLLGKEKRKYEKRVEIWNAVWGREAFGLTTETSLEKAWKSSFLIDH